MSECIDPKIGRLLYAYELGALTDEDMERFELHLFKCEYCLNQLKDSEVMARLLRSDQKVISATQIEIQRQGKSESLISRLWRRLWPKGSLFLKPALTYLLILLMIVPAYWGITKKDADKVGTVTQSIELIPPIRGSQETMVIDGRLKGRADIAFYLEGARVGEKYMISIESSEGRIIYEDDSFDAFDENQYGRLSLSVSEFDAGKYTLKILPQSKGSLVEPQEYIFEISD